MVKHCGKNIQIHTHTSNTIYIHIDNLKKIQKYKFNWQ